MKANCWIRPNTVEIRDVPDPQILSPRDAIIRVSSAAICGSDLHLYNGFVPAMRKGDVLGHEMMGEIVEVGSEVRDRAVGDRVVVAFPIACGRCNACAAEAYSLCENSNPNASLAEKTLGRSPAGIFGYSHLFGGYPGGQAEFARVPYADVGTVRSRTISRTSACCSCPTCSRPVGWPRRCATSRPVT
jgi:threonine dehydrogenase-like Zn-dependent dehydrogenase